MASRHKGTMQIFMHALARGCVITITKKRRQLLGKWMSSNLLGQIQCIDHMKFEPCCKRVRATFGKSHQV